MNEWRHAAGKKSAATNKKRYGKDYYATIGAAGGRAGNNGGFASTSIGPDGLDGRTRARIAGAKGGSASRRTK